MSKRSKSAKPLVMLLLALIAGVSQAKKNMFTHRIFFDMGAMVSAPDKLITNIKRVSGLGFNGVVVVDWMTGDADKQTAKVKDKYRRVRETAKAHNIQLIPVTQNPAVEQYDFGESFPVKKTKFVVANGKARASGDHEIGLQNGGFESSTQGKPANWGLSNLPKNVGFVDKTVYKSGAASFRVKAAPEYSRITQSIKLKPWRAYQVSGWFRTKALRNHYMVQFGVDPNMLYRRERPFGAPGHWSTLSPTNPNWSKCVIDFNSLSHSHGKLSLWFCYKLKGGQVGDIWVDDIEVKEVGLYETVRNGRPLIVKSADGTTTYKEGTDYELDPICNSLTKKSFDYEGHLKIPDGSSIQEGQELRVDWYQYANVHTIIPSADHCPQEFWTKFQNDVDRADMLIGHSDAMFCNNTEWRVAGWNDKCATFQFKTGGEYMANAMQTKECLLRRTGNGCRTIFSWSDMFDPWHNSWHKYAWVKGGSWQSWKGLSNRHIIANWHANGYMKESFMFFAGLDTIDQSARHPQLVCFFFDTYDVDRRMGELEKAEAEGVDNVVGCIISDWYNPKYPYIENVVANLKARGRWGNNPFPVERCQPLTEKECAVGIASRPSPAAHVSSRMLRTISATGSDIVLEYHLAHSQNITLKAFDLFGREVNTLINGKQKGGTHRTTWKASALPAGVYFLRFAINRVEQQTLKQPVF